MSVFEPDSRSVDACAVSREKCDLDSLDKSTF